MLFADLGLSLEPALPTLGLPVLLVIALALAALTVWTYLGVQRATFRRVLTLVLLRLLALATALLMVLRPSFATTQLEGIEISKLFVLFDASESMNVADVEGKPTRWQQMNTLWESRDVQRRLEELKAVQKIEVVKYLAAEDLRPDEATEPKGRRTDIGAWLHQLFVKHGHEKHQRGIIVFSDGADNGTTFSAQQMAGDWKGIAPIYAFGVGDPTNEKFKKDIGLTRLDVKPKPVIVKAKMDIDAVAQAPGFEKAKVDVSVWIEEVEEKKPQPIKEVKDFAIMQEKDQAIRVQCDAPEHPGEYKLTLKIAPQPGEANLENNEISTYIQVVKPRLNVLWVDRFRVYEPRFAIDAIRGEERFAVHYVEPPSDGKADPFKIYKLDQPYDVIVIGDISAQRFAQSKPEVFERIKEMVGKKTGLLMLGGEETFAKGDWQAHPALMSLLPVKFDGAAKFSTTPVHVEPTRGAPKFLQLHPVPLEDKKIWEEHFLDLDGLAPLGTLVKDSTVLLGVDGKEDRPVMVARQAGLAGRVVVFAADGTSRGWYQSPEAIQGHHVFWKQLIAWLARHEDNANELWIKLDKRRLSTDPNDILGFTFGLRDKGGEVIGAKFDAVIVGPKDQKTPARFARDGQHQRGSFQGAKETGEYKIVIEGKEVKASGTARFLVADDNVEMLRPAADHDALIKIAAASDGRFQLAQEADLLQLLDELKDQASRDARQKTVHWPDWQRLPPSDHLRDQLAGLWNSFALVGFALFVALIGTEWLLRRLWGLV